MLKVEMSVREFQEKFQGKEKEYANSNTIYIVCDAFLQIAFHKLI